ncbi:MAG: collagen binding domain-containing protein [Anaerovoracaceae bacterium]
MKKTTKELCAVVLITAVFLTCFAGFAVLSYGAEQSMTIDIVQSKLQYGYDSSGKRYFPNMYGLFSTKTTGVYGGAVYCAEHDRAVTTGIRTGYIITDPVLRKIMYYGYRGPSEWSGFSQKSINGKYKIGGPNTDRHEICGTVVTAQALSDRYRALGGQGTVCYPAGLKEFISYVNSKPEPDNSYTVYKVDAGKNKQDMIFARYEPKGMLTLKKSAANYEELLMLCPESYSLEGAQYGVYTSKTLSDDSKVGSLSTDVNGNTNNLTLDVGTYYVKETRAPKGFYIDSKVYEIAVTAGNKAMVLCSDKPKLDPLDFVLQKKSAEGADSNLSVAGAEYTVKYYKGYYDTEEQVNNMTPFRTWVFKTDDNGIFRIGDNWRLSGDEIYKNERGLPVGLLGTYTIEETKAPTGFAKTEGIISIQQVRELSGEDRITVLKDVIDVENPQTVSITIQKTDAETGEAVPQGYGTFAGAEYTVTRYNQITGEDQIMGTIITDQSGKGTLAGLQPGKYEVRETKAPSGYVLSNEVIQVNACIKELNTANFDYTVEAKETPTTTVIEKYETEGGEKRAVAGAKLQLLDRRGNIIEEWTTREEPHEIKGLSAGEYTLRETKAPPGNLRADDIVFEIKEGKAVTKVNMEDEYTKVQISKTDITTGKELPGANLQIIDKEGNVVDEWTSTDKPHMIERLEPGEYILHEEAAPAGYMTAENIEFTVEETGKIQKVEMKDPVKAEYTLFPFNFGRPDMKINIPLTGDSSDIHFNIGLMCAVPFLIFSLAFATRRNNMKTICIRKENQR